MHLKKYRFRYIIVTGVFSDGCVMATICGGFSKGYHFIIAKDLIETTDDEERQVIQRYPEREDLAVDVRDNGRITSHTISFFAPLISSFYIHLHHPFHHFLQRKFLPHAGASRRAHVARATPHRSSSA